MKEMKRFRGSINSIRVLIEKKKLNWSQFDYD